MQHVDGQVRHLLEALLVESEVEADTAADDFGVLGRGQPERRPGAAMRERSRLPPPRVAVRGLPAGSLSGVRDRVAVVERRGNGCLTQAVLPGELKDGGRSLLAGLGRRRRGLGLGVLLPLPTLGVVVVPDPQGSLAATSSTAPYENPGCDRGRLKGSTE